MVAGQIVDALLGKTKHRRLDVTDYLPKGGPAFLNPDQGKEYQVITGAALSGGVRRKRCMKNELKSWR